MKKIKMRKKDVKMMVAMIDQGLMMDFKLACFVVYRRGL